MKKLTVFKILSFWFFIGIIVCLVFFFGLYSGAKQTVAYDAVRALKESVEKVFFRDENRVIVNGQSRMPDGRFAAVSLSFDDGEATQADIAIPLLNKYGVKATFYVIPSNITTRLSKWKQAIADGHEIGSHTLTHPCSGNFPFSKTNPLENFSLEQIRLEIVNSNNALDSLLSVKPVSFAYPCGQSFVGRGRNLQSYVPIIAENFITGRGYLDEGINDLSFYDTANLMGASMDNKDFSEIKIYIDDAIKRGGWLILVGHKVGHDVADRASPLTTYISMLDELIKYTMNSDNRIWLAPVKEVADYLELNKPQKSYIGQ